jgi:PIN domain nuclease of toxin-antitoxin system
MKLLLDTHIFLWYITADARLPPEVRDAIRDADHPTFLSVASAWEIVVKNAIGKLPLPVPPEQFLPAERERHRISTLSIDESALVFLARLPALHSDPFDRIIIAQAMQHGFTLATTDVAVRRYPVSLFPNP